jgi:hypothetical protein
VAEGRSDSPRCNGSRYSGTAILKLASSFSRGPFPSSWEELFGNGPEQSRARRCLARRSGPLAARTVPRESSSRGKDRSKVVGLQSDSSIQDIAARYTKRSFGVLAMLSESGFHFSLAEPQHMLQDHSLSAHRSAGCASEMPSRQRLVTLHIRKYRHSTGSFPILETSCGHPPRCVSF